MKVAPLGLQSRRGIELRLRIVSRIGRGVKMMKPVGCHDVPYGPDAIQGRANLVVEVYRRMHK